MAGKATKARRTSSTSHRRSGRRWSATVTTDSTHPPPGLFTKSAPTVARVLASKKVSPKGLASGLRMLTFYINRAGRNMSKARLSELRRAKKLLSERIHKAKAKS